jgi:hypothetical protein
MNAASVGGVFYLGLEFSGNCFWLRLKQIGYASSLPEVCQAESELSRYKP